MISFCKTHGKLFHLIFQNFRMLLIKAKTLELHFVILVKPSTRVRHKGLLFKSRQMGISGHFLDWFRCYLDNRTQRVALEASADPEGGPGVRTPLRFVRGGVLCTCLMGRRGDLTVVFTLLVSFFSGSLRSPVLYKHITYIHTFKFNIQYETVILCLYIVYEKNPTNNPLLS